MIIFKKQQQILDYQTICAAKLHSYQLFIIYAVFSQQRQRIKSLETEIEGYKKQIAKEEEHNEKLTLVLNKCEVDIATSKKLLDICNRKMEALKTEYSTYTRMLYETEEALNRASAVRFSILCVYVTPSYYVCM